MSEPVYITTNGPEYPKETVRYKNLEDDNMSIHCIGQNESCPTECRFAKNENKMYSAMHIERTELCINRKTSERSSQDSTGKNSVSSAPVR